MIKSIAERLQLLEQEDKEAYNALVGNLKPQTGKKGEMLLHMGEVAKTIYFIESGLIRHFRYDKEGKEYNTWFSFEGDIVLSMRGFVAQSPCKVAVELVEDSSYGCITHKKLVSLLDEYRSLEKVFREMLLVYYLELEERQHRIQAYDAQSKYNYLATKQPRLLERLPQNHVASYLGISRETLSRMRSKSRKDKKTSNL